MKKRLLSLLMAMCLMATMVPAAFAAESDVTTEKQLTAAVSSANPGDTITLGANITLSSPLSVDKAVTINGAGYTLTAGNFTAIKVTASGAVIKNMNIKTDAHGISFDANGLTGHPTLDVTGTTISKITVDAQTGVCYQADSRGINTHNLKGGTVNIEDCEILGFKYSINPVVDVVSSVDMYLRDGKDTVFNIERTLIKGWTALNMWSVNTDYNFKNCTLIGISNLNGGGNHFSTIRVNDGIYGSATGKNAAVKFIGGTLMGVRYGTSTQSLIHAGYDEKTDFIFEKSGRNPVNLTYFGIENVEGALEQQINIWNFYFQKDEAQYQQFLADRTTGFPSNVILKGGPISEYEDTFA